MIHNYSQRYSTYLVQFGIRTDKLQLLRDAHLEMLQIEKASEVSVAVLLSLLQKRSR